MSTSFTEEFKDQKINSMIEDLLILEKEISNVKEAIVSAIHEVPGALDSCVNERLREILTVGEDIEKDFNEHRASLDGLKENAKHEITKHFSLVLGDLKNDLKSLTETYRQEIKKTKPISTGKVIAYCFTTVLGLSAICSSSAYFILEARHESELAKFGTGMVELSSLTEKAINLVPKNQQQDFKQKYDSIMKSER
ncbi:hypothetical protein FH968_19980 [Buttiauxella sp. B2]|uniref:hypothetical protein n=1 Tax=Buttiauxella sp. B2 TaxID=2587812 RepID=UPI00111CF150|nr:hypothetical protein [Buttiauxella sp. B2]TNV16120.1 hypothetical protein FH968_19980 [Buttiauxella sp. B2]